MLERPMKSLNDCFYQCKRMKGVSKNEPPEMSDDELISVFVPSLHKATLCDFDRTTNVSWDCQS
jgi:hypothetical protein